MKQYITSLILCVMSLSAGAMEEGAADVAASTAEVAAGTEPVAQTEPAVLEEPSVVDEPVAAPGPDLDYFALMCSATSEMTPEQQTIFVTSGQIQQERDERQQFLAEPAAVLEQTQVQYEQVNQEILTIINEQLGEQLDQLAQALLASPEGEGLTTEQAKAQVIDGITADIKAENGIPPTLDVALAVTVQAECGFVLDYQEQLAANGCKETAGKSFDISTTVALCSSVATEVAEINSASLQAEAIQAEANAQIQQIQEKANAEIGVLLESSQKSIDSIAAKLTQIIGTVAPAVVSAGS